MPPRRLGPWLSLIRGIEKVPSLDWVSGEDRGERDYERRLSRKLDWYSVVKGQEPNQG